MNTFKKVFWKNKWTSALILLLACTLFVVIYNIQQGSTWNLTDMEELGMSMTLPMLISVCYLIIRMIGEGFRRKGEPVRQIQIDKPIGIIRQLSLSIGISLLVCIFFLLISLPTIDFLSIMLYQISLNVILSRCIAIIFLILALWSIFRWFKHVVRSVKLRADEKNQKFETKMILVYSILIWIFFIFSFVFAFNLMAQFFLFSSL